MPVIERVGKAPNERPQRTWKRKLLIGLGYLTLLLAGVVLLVLKLTSPMVERFDALRSAAQSGRASEAYALMSNEYRKLMPLDGFKSFLAESGLSAAQKVNWSSRKIKGVSDGATGALDGSMTLRDGSVVPVNVRFVRELGAWRIHAIDRTLNPKNSGATGESR